ncbi:MAG: S8 family serine peptidase [Planctomycetota bacterium]|nr:S8 family serine peptidase [Planctomycetota bacterium]
MRQLVVPAAFLASLLSACTTGDGDVTPIGAAGSVSGALSFVPETAPLTEVEPNDAVDEPQRIGDLVAGRVFTIRGSIAEGEGFDGFAFVARERLNVEADLRFVAQAGRRVELGVYDPLAMGVVARGGAEGKAAITASGPFDLVVRAAQGAGEYELVVRAVAAPPTIARAGWVGALSTGDRLRVGSEVAARYELTATEALDLRITSGGPGESGVRALTVSEAGDGPATSLASGAPATLALQPLERIAIEVPAGSQATIEALPRSGTAPLVWRTDRLLASERERASFGLATGDVLYGRAPSNARAGDVLVKVRAGADLSQELMQRGLARTGQIGEEVLQVAADLGGIADEAVRARTTVALARSLAASPRVEYAELNRVRRAFGGTTPFVPDDDFYGLQWHYPLIRLPEAWGEVRNFITGPGPDVVVAVIDTGRRSHPDLDANLLTSIEYDFITDPASADDGDGPDANALDEGDGEGFVPSSFHGTHVAGTIAAVSNNATGVAGVGSVPVGTPTATSRVKVVHLRVLGKGGGTDADIARAIRYAAGLTNTGIPTLLQQADIINMSLGGPGSSATVQNEVTAAHNRGVTIFAAAGNENSSSPSYPAAYANVISVAAVDQNSVRAPYSNFHPTVDLCAPGGDTSVNTNPGTGPGQDSYVDGVLSTLVDEGGSTPIYVFYQGTSMACPHAAGLAALMKVVTPTLSPAEIEADLTQTATDLGATGRDNLYGFGLINAQRAVQVAGTGAPGTPVFAVSPTALNFAPYTSQIQLSLLNIGGGSLDVQTFTSDQPWLTLVNGGAGAGIDIGRLTVNVDRSDTALAADGTYTATISITTNVNDLTVPVAVEVSTPVFPDIDLIVLAVDLSVDPPVTVAETVVNPSIVGFAYVLDELSTVDGQLLPAGDYLIACGTDESGNNAICGVGDVYCGLYPTLNDPALVTVNGTVNGINFVVAPIDSGTTLTAFQGYPRLRR